MPLNKKINFHAQRIDKSKINYLILINILTLVSYFLKFPLKFNFFFNKFLYNN
jgi:hypothetical protein